MYQTEDNVIVTDNIPLKEIYKGGVGHFCFRFMRKHLDKTAEIDVETDQKETFGSLLTKSIRTSIALETRGIRKGDNIIIYSKIQLCASVPMLSCFFIGAVPIFLDAELTLPESINLIKKANAKLVMTTSKMVDVIKNILEEVIRINIDIIILDDIFEEHQEIDPKFQPIYVDDLKETAVIHFSSGTTGLPKGFCYSHYSILRRNLIDYDDLWLNDEMKISFSRDSFHWTIETLRLICSTRDGICRLIDPEPFNAMRIWRLLEKYKVNLACIIPHELMDMCNSGIPRDLDISNLTTIITYGSKFSKSYRLQIQEMLPHVDVFPMYGISEVGPITTFRKCELHREYNKTSPGSVGIPRNGFGNSYKVVDLDTGVNLGPGQTGELYVKSDSAISGYINMEKCDQFDENGWFRTGDLVVYDKNFCFFVMDRIKDVIIFQGWHIPPSFIEEELLMHPAVKKAAVIGIPHELDGEQPMGLVALKNNCEGVTHGDIERYVVQKVPERFQLRAGVKIIDESHFQIGRKIKRHLLKTLVLSGKI